MASSKDAVVLELDGHEVRVSSPEKPYFGDKGVRKIDVVEYFVSVGAGILFALRDRPTTQLRHAQGYEPRRPLVGHHPNPQPRVAGHGQRQGSRARTGRHNNIGNTAPNQ